MTKFYLIMLVSSFYLLGCKTASKSFQKGDYADAIEIGVKKLSKNPDDRETLELVRSAYTHAANYHEEQIRILSNSKSEDRFEGMYREYREMQHLFNTIRQYPSVARLINATDYSSYLETYGEKAAEVHVEKAVTWEEQETKRAFREAYNEYRAALKFRPNDIDLKQRRDRAYNAALTKVLVIPMRRDGGYGYTSSYQLQNFQNDIMRTLSFNMGSDFVKFYTEWDLRNKNLEPDQVMELNLGRVIIGRPYDERSTREVSKQVVVKETVYKPDSVVKEYGTVRARITTTKRTLVSEGDLYIHVRDVKGRILWDDRFSGQYRWQVQFATYTGDERALSESDKSLLNRTSNNEYPREEEIMERLYKEIENDLSYRLRNYFARY